MTAAQTISDVASAVMPSVVSDFAALYPGAPALAWEVSTRAAAHLGAPPRIVWVPHRDDFTGPQKLPRGGQDAQRSVATRVAGVRCVCWGESIAAVEALVECLVRHLLVKAGPAGVGVTVVDGRWVEETGETTLGEGYALAITFPVDIRASRTAGTRVSVDPALDTTTANPTPGDTALDSGDLP